VQDFIPPEIFSRFEEMGRQLGFANVASAPFVRSSYHSEEAYQKIQEVLNR
jgi:lipoic acid synthetase